MAQAMDRPRAWLMAHAIKKFNEQEELIIREVEQGIEAADEGRVTGTRELVIEGVPFIAIYRQFGADQLHILRVLHDAQQWPSAD